MREITLQPGAVIDIDGVRIRAAEPNVFAVGGWLPEYDPATGAFVADEGASGGNLEIMVDVDAADMIRASLANWLSTGDLSQAPLLREAITEVARNLARFGEEPSRPCEAAASSPSSQPVEAGTRE